MVQQRCCWRGCPLVALHRPHPVTISSAQRCLWSHMRPTPLHPLHAATGANSTWWNVYAPGKQLGLPMYNKTVDCSTGPLLNWIGLFASRWAPFLTESFCARRST